MADVAVVESNYRVALARSISSGEIMFEFCNLSMVSLTLANPLSILFREGGIYDFPEFRER